MHALEPGCLDGLKVLDLSRRHSYYCGKSFAGMGADVILIEPPVTGCAQRHEAPFIGNTPNLEHAIPFFYFNAGKRGITLDITHARGQDLFRQLASTADLIIEDQPPGGLDQLGLTHASLAQARPSLCITRITPFGQQGPWAHWAADDLTLLALGGFLNMTGYPDIHPTAAYGSQAYAMGNMFGMVGSMLAVLQAQISGHGQEVDIAIQECVTMALENAAQFYDLEKRVRTRFAGSQRQAGTGIFECADGYVYIFAGGMAAIRFWPNLVQWMKDAEVPGVEVMEGTEWSDMAFLNSDKGKDTFADLFTTFARTRTKEALYREGQSRRVPICPVSTPADVAVNKQLQYREFFAQVRHPASGRDITMPGAPFRLSEAPWRVHRPAPQLGEHNAEVYGALGISDAELNQLRAAGVL